MSEKHCPINEQTGDGTIVGRCWYYVPDGVCPRHGDVSKELRYYEDTHNLTLERRRNEIPKEYS